MITSPHVFDQPNVSLGVPDDPGLDRSCLNSLPGILRSYQRSLTGIRYPGSSTPLATQRSSEEFRGTERISLGIEREQFKQQVEGVSIWNGPMIKKI